MPSPVLLPSGALHPDLFNNTAFVKYVNGGRSSGGSGTQADSAPAPSVKMMVSEEDLREKERSFTEAFRSGRLKVTDLTDRFDYSQVRDEYDGKTVIENRPMGLIVGTIDRSVITASDAERSAKAGAPTHAFLYESTSFLFDAAKEYSALGENEVFRYRNIDDVNFVRNAIDFLTNGNYTQGDVNAAQKQMTGIVRELAAQLKNGGEADVSSLKGKLTIGGAEVSISQLMEMQKVGREVSESFQGHTSGSLHQQNIQSFAAMGIAKAAGSYYGSSQGAIGSMFSAAVDRLYEKGKTQVEKTNAWAAAVNKGYSSGTRDAAKTQLRIADLFAQMDTGSKSGLTNSFSSSLTQMRSLVQQYCKQYGLTASYVGLAGATDGITKQFQSWMDKL